MTNESRITATDPVSPLQLSGNVLNMGTIAESGPTSSILVGGTLTNNGSLMSLHLTDNGSLVNNGSMRLGGLIGSTGTLTSATGSQLFLQSPLVVEMELRGDDESAPSGLGIRPAVVLMSNARRVRVCGIQRCQSL